MKFHQDLQHGTTFVLQVWLAGLTFLANSQTPNLITANSLKLLYRKICLLYVNGKLKSGPEKAKNQFEGILYLGF